MEAGEGCKKRVAGQGGESLVDDGGQGRGWRKVEVRGKGRMEDRQEDGGHMEDGGGKREVDGGRGRKCEEWRTGGY